MQAKSRRSHLAPACLCLLVLSSCGGGERQDESEPEGEFKVRVVRAEFPAAQALAQRADLKITVRNAEATRSVPNIAVTVKGFDTRLENPGLADPGRPVFVINGEPKEIGGYPESKEKAPAGGETAYNGTWALGRLEPGRQKTFRWTVTAVRAGPYRLSYEVAAGLDGKAKAVGTGGRAPKGLLTGTIDGEAPDTRVGEDGRSIVEGVR
ncbi:MAG: hypothetical protein H0V50_01370 [Thermoleophilaceae bacterium]|nr:hypothetical protein [Thermoleophilaceae bacterium]